MDAFEYASPTTKEQAVALLAGEWGSTELLAGGTDLLSLMKDYLVTPKRVVNIKSVQELKGLRYTAGSGLRLGALVTIAELVEHPQARKEYPALIQAAEGIASPQIRSLGTVGGDLCQRPRCWYFRNGFGLLAKDEQGGSLVADGDNRYHAILGNSGPAYFVNPSSLAPALIALGAKVQLFGPGGARELSLDRFFVIPKTEQDREYALKPNEILLEVLVPPATKVRSATYEVRQKEALDWPLVAAAVALNLDGNKIRTARVVLGHVAPIPWKAPEAEKVLAGKTVTEDLAAEAGQAAVSQASPLSRNAYKVQLARVAVKRAVLQAAQGGV
ncbi:MAG: xanthine dehydrogenase family protein subunit M [Acidobacteria bacterium]|nr:xanthine dehydrogenase family protein subunit M [Acidobacteriota bacterium]